MKTITGHVEDYLTLRRNLGFKLECTGYILRSFARYCDGRGEAYITTESALRWAVMPDNIQPAQRGVRFSMVRMLARYVSSMDPRTEIPPAGFLPAKKMRSVPAFYRDEQIVALVRSALDIRKTDPFKGVTCSTLIGLLAATGMRVSEALGLRCEDVDLKEGVLHLWTTKGDRQRLVPVHPTVTHQLIRYLEIRNHRNPLPPVPNFFVTSRGTRLPYSTVNTWFLVIARRIGLRGAAPVRGIRLHDLRHHFAVKTLLSWYRQGEDAGIHLPRLATYLGHGHVRDTYWYLSAVPELLQFASRRWKSQEGGLL
jgi:integrase/recombinase XerD